MKTAKMFLIAILLIAVSLFAWMKLAAPPAPIRIGYIGSLSGKFSDMGKTCRNGALLAAEEINSSGGINGRIIEFIFKDDNSTPSKSLKMAQELYAEGINIIVGPFTSASAAEVLDFINTNRILTIGPVIAGDKMAGKDDYFIKMFPSTARFGKELAELAIIGMNLKKLAIITDDNNRAYSQPIADNFISTTKQFNKIITGQTKFSSATDFSYSELADSILNNNPDGLLIVAGPLHTAMIIQQLRLKGSDIQCFTPAWSANEDLITGGGKAVEGTLMYVPFDGNSQYFSYQDFYNKYQSRFAASPSFCSAFNYDSIMMLAEALRHTDKITPDNVKRSIISIGSYQGVQSKFTVDINGDAMHKLILQTIKNGEFTQVKSK